MTIGINSLLGYFGVRRSLTRNNGVGRVLRRLSATGRRVFLLTPILLIGVLPASAQTPVTDLSDRGIPRATKLYEDQSGAYYGAFLTGARSYKPSWPLKEQFFFVFAVRKVQPDGSIFDVVPVRTESKYKSEGDGYALSDRELARIRDKIIPAVEEKVPNFDRGSAGRNFPIRFYVEDLHLDRTGLPVDSNDTAENVIFEVWLFEQDGDYQTEYQKDGFPGMLADQFPVTVADVRERFDLAESATTDTIGDNTAVITAFEADIEAWRAARLAREIERLEDSRKLGFVYKGHASWTDYPNSDDVRDILHGDFEYIDHPAHFAQIYITYVSEYSRFCSEFLQGPYTVRTTTRFEKDPFGNWEQDGEPIKTKMETRFSDHYDKVESILAMDTAEQMINVTVDAILQGDLFFTGAWELLVDDVLDSQAMGNFLLSETCNSPTVQQLADNLHALAAGDSPVQKSGSGYARAAEYSTPFERADAERSLVQRYHLFTHAKSTTFGYPLVDAEVTPYRTGVLAKDGYDQVAELFTIGKNLSRVMQPVLTCFYGPVGRYDGGQWRFERRHFWYQQTPADLPLFLAAAPASNDIDPGLRHARTSCPGSTQSADEITGPIPEPWNNVLFTFYKPTLNNNQSNSP